MMIEDKPTLDDQLLEHHGVKGMRWGQRKARPSDHKIRTARINVTAQQARVFNQGAKATAATVGRKPGAAKERAKYKDMNASYLKNPDRVTSLYMTRGERAAHAALLLTPAAPIAAQRIVGTVVARKGVERAQAARAARG